MPALAETRIPTQFRFEARKPSDLIRSGQPESNLGLMGLIRFGYDFEGLTQAELLKRTLEEYGGEDHRRQTYLAFDGKRLVGSVTFGLWKPKEAKRGQVFWNALPANIRYAAEEISPLAVEMVGIVVLPQFLGKGIGGEMLDEGVEVLKPSIIVGETKTPQQAASRARVLGRRGYRTFLGETELTPGNESFFSLDHKALLDAYLVAKQKKLERGRTLHTSPNILRPTVPETSAFPKIIQDAFATIIEEQKALKRRVTVVKPLISVRSEVLKAAA